MKKILAAVLFVVILLAVTAVACADTYSVADRAAIPDPVRALLDKEKLSGYTATSYAECSGYGFVVMQGSGKNLLYVFREKGGSWSLQFKTGNAIKQGRGLTLVQPDDSGRGVIITYDYGHDYTEDYYSPGWLLTMYYQLKSDGTWRLRFFRDEDLWVSIDINENRLAYYGGMDAEEFQGSAYGTVQTDLRYVYLANVPRTLKEARQGLTLAPSLPSGSLGAEVIEFKGGQKFEVYSGPGTDYLRGANGKALVSTNDWIQVFGMEDGWIMVQYAINTGHYRIGYIQAKALPKNANVADLALPASLCRTAWATDVTDDPLFSAEALTSLTAGVEVTMLGTLGEYAYIEGYAGGMFRGFVPLSSLVSVELETAVPASPDTEAQPSGTLTGASQDPYGIVEVLQRISGVISSAIR